MLHTARHRLLLFLLLFLLLILAAVAAVAREPDRQPPDGFRSLAPGLEYRHELRPSIPLSIHVLRIERARQPWDIRVGLGQGTVFGLEPLDIMTARTAKAIHQPALAAINGDFFVIKPGPYQGDTRGLQISDGELVSRPAGSSFWIAAGGELKIGPVASKLRVVWPDGKAETPLGLNEARADDAVVLYTPTLGIRLGDAAAPPCTRTQGGRELVLEIVHGGLSQFSRREEHDLAQSLDRRENGTVPLTLHVGNAYSARVREVRDRGDTPLAPDRLILSIGPKQIDKLPAVKAGDLLKLAIETEPDLRGVPTAIGAGRILIRDGKLPDLGPAKQPRHPRSLVGWNAQHLFFMVIDGRQPKLSIGMTYPEMAALARQYGCSAAVELDGGGSSTLWAQGKILNSPSDGSPRAVANGLILFRKQKP